MSFSNTLRFSKFSTLPQIPLKILLIGAPGSGKGTQASWISRDFGLKPLSTGQSLRDHVSQKTDLGLKINEDLAKGILLSDTIMRNLVYDILLNYQHESWLLDGYPRTLQQAKDLTEVLKETNQKLDTIIYIKVDPKVIWERVQDRLVHLPSGRTYNTKYNPPKVPGRDDVTGEPLIQREDDKWEVVKSRQESFLSQTLPVLEYFDNQGLLKTVECKTSHEGYKNGVKPFLDQLTKLNSKSI